MKILSMADQFCLRWNNFQANIVSAFDLLKNSEDLVDVTLTCEGRNIKAHKVILSACSPYFKSLFKENPCPHPVIILKDVLAEDIANLLAYMYQGEVFIEESKLPSFLNTATLLQIKGLTGVTKLQDTSTTTTNKLFNQLSISHTTLTRDNKLKKRRHSSDKRNGTNDAKKSKSNELVIFPEIVNQHLDENKQLPGLVQCVGIEKNNNIDMKIDENVDDKEPLSLTQQIKNVSVKHEVNDEDNISENDENSAHIDRENIKHVSKYENSMLARSLLSGIHPNKNECTNNVSLKTTSQVNNTDLNGTDVIKPTNTIEDNVKIERQSNEDENELDVVELKEHLSISYGMGGASTSSGPIISIHQQHSNHAAICGNCPHCGKKYSNQSALKYHVRFMHSDLTNRLCCYLCPSSFTMRESFKDHMWSVHGQRN